MDTRRQISLTTRIEGAPGTLMGLLEGWNFSKLVVRVSPDPTQ